MTVRQGIETDVRGTLLHNAARVGYLPNRDGHLVNAADIFVITVYTTVYTPNIVNTWTIPVGEVHVAITIEERKDGVRPTGRQARH